MALFSASCINARSSYASTTSGESEYKSACVSFTVQAYTENMQTKYLSFMDFLCDVSIQYERQKGTYPHQRYGQMYFNMLAEVRPDISEKIRGGRLDPFHRDDVSKLTHMIVESNW